MTDEQRWLLLYGRRWVDWWELEDSEATLGVSELFERMMDYGKLEVDVKTNQVRLKTKEENEPVRV